MSTPAESVEFIAALGHDTHLRIFIDPDLVTDLKRKMKLSSRPAGHRRVVRRS
jgi:hypothetical protein